MNVDILTNLIESMDVSSFRTLVSILSPSFGLGEWNFCDGPYDGGKDFSIINGRNGFVIGVQISIEKNWQKKIDKDIQKLKKIMAVMWFILFQQKEFPSVLLKELKIIYMGNMKLF